MPEPTGPKAGDITDDSLIASVEIDVSDLVGRLQREALRLLKELSQQGLDGDELASAVGEGLRDMPESPVDTAARGAVSESFNLGRNLGAQAVLDKVQRVVRTEVLDINTCRRREAGEPDRCRELDGTTYAVNSPEYFEFMPPNKCRGQEQCRGFFMYLTEAA